MVQHLDSRYVFAILSDPSTFVAGGPNPKTRLEFSIKKFQTFFNVYLFCFFPGRKDGEEDGEKDATVQIGFVADVRCPYLKSLAPNGIVLVSDG